ncbi:hypothetical protein TNIN_163251, partial [Trichonephila inaurata madagascariensis]
YYVPSGYDYDSPVDEKYTEVYPYPEKRKSSKYGPLVFALGLLPLGLLLACAYSCDNSCNRQKT